MAITNGFYSTLSSVSDILKEYYLGPVAEQLNNEVFLVSRLESRSEDLVGKRAYIPLHTSRSGGIGARAENDSLPAAGNQTYSKAVYDLKYLYGRVSVTGPSMAKTKNEAGSFLQALKSELDGIRNDLRKDLARQIYGDGTARIATCAATTTSATVNLNTAGGAEAIRKGQLYVGMVVDIGTAADVDTIAAARTITAVSYANSTITISGATVTTTTSHYVTRAGSAVDGAAAASGSRSNEVDGIKRLVSDAATTVGEIDASTATFWDNQRVDANGAIDLEKIQKTLNLVRLEGGMPSVMITTLGVQRELYLTLEDQVQYIDPASLNYAAGFRTLSYAGMPIISDIDAPYGKMYVLDESTLKVFSDQDWHFLDADGQTLRQRADHDAFEAIMARYINLGATKRSNQAVLYGITVDGGTGDPGI
jgi:hypothetical protein